MQFNDFIVMARDLLRCFHKENKPAEMSSIHVPTCGDIVRLRLLIGNLCHTVQQEKNKERFLKENALS